MLETRFCLPILEKAGDPLPQSYEKGGECGDKGLSHHSIPRSHTLPLWRGPGSRGRRAGAGPPASCVLKKNCSCTHRGTRPLLGTSIQSPKAPRTWPGRENHNTPVSSLSAVEQNVYPPRSSKGEPGLAPQHLMDAVTNLTLLNVGQLNQGSKMWWNEGAQTSLGRAGNGLESSVFLPWVGLNYVACITHFDSLSCMAPPV